MKSEVLYLDDAYAYLKGLLEKSNIFKNEAVKIREEIRSTKGSAMAQDNFLNLMNRFRIPTWLYGQIAMYIEKNGKTDFLSDQVIYDDPFLEDRSNGSRLIPHVLLSVPINITKTDLSRCWDIVQKKRAQCENTFWGGRKFMNKNALWRTPSQFDLAFVFYELTMLRKIPPQQAIEIAATKGVLPKGSEPSKGFGLDYVANLQKITKKLHRQIAALQLTKNLEKAQQKILPLEKPRY